MENIKNFLKERASGLLLIVFAVFIITGISISSHRAQSQIAQNTTNAIQTSNEGQILGETNDNPEEITNDSEEVYQDAEVNNDENTDQEEEQNEEEKTKEDKTTTEDDYYNDLKERLKKYCGKKSDIKKCKDYLTEAKDARNKGERFKELYKKYHFEKKKVVVSNSTISSTASENIKTTLVIKLNGDSKSYEIESAKGVSVLDLMRQGNISYDILNDGRIDNIGGEKKESGNFSWMLYACKNGTCKMTPAGPSEFKIDGYDKIEWRYLDWTTMGMDDWNTW